MALITELTPLLLKVALVLVILLVSLIVLRKKQSDNKMEEKYEASLKAVLFLLHNEEKHCEEHNLQHGQTFKNTMRKRVTIEDGLTWNSKFSKSGCLSELNKLKSNKKKDQTFLIEFFKGLLLKAVK